MQKKPYGCLTVPGLLTALLVILLVVVAGLLRGGELFSPGLLNAQAGAVLGGVTSHAQIGGRCSTCHAFFWQKAKMADRCVACHSDVAAQQQDPSTLHGYLLAKSPGIACRTCHPDHHGADAPLTDLSKVDISHDAFGYSLTAHQKQTDGTPFVCKTCHINGYKVFDQTVCISCHQQIKADFMQSHLQAYGENCLACHDGIDTYNHNFDHSLVSFQLTGEHTPLDCGACHTGARSITDLQATPQDCYSCHAKDDAHTGQFGTDCSGCHSTSGWLPATFDHSKSKFPLTGAHVGLECAKCHPNNVFTPLDTACYSCHAKDDAHNRQFGTDCSICHTTTAWLPATFDHSLTNFPLTGAHTNLECSKCHINNVFTTLDTACVSCHAKDDAHSGQFGTDCSICHTTTAWLPATFDHSLTNFPLTGAHASLDCSQCHENLVFTSLPTDCYSCHAKDDAHSGQFGTDCSMCHSTTAWLPATFDHSLTNFPLTGAHVGVDCTKCHINNNFTNISTACSSCHSDPAFHAGLFGGMSCDQCHNTSAWSPASFNLSHPSSCGEVTCIGHEGATCRDCHTVNLSTSTCLKCHDSNNPVDGGGGDD